MKIKIIGIEIQAMVGTQDHERTNHQKIVVDLEFDYDAAKAIENDGLEYAPDYSEIVKQVIRTAKENRFYLLETLSDKILKILRENKTIISAKVTVKKPSAIKNIAYVSAETNF
jgi:FolB domain-containing protein